MRLMHASDLPGAFRVRAPPGGCVSGSPGPCQVRFGAFWGVSKVLGVYREIPTKSYSFRNFHFISYEFGISARTFSICIRFQKFLQIWKDQNASFPKLQEFLKSDAN